MSDLFCFLFSHVFLAYETKEGKLILVSFENNRAGIRYPLSDDKNKFFNACYKAGYKTLQVFLSADSMVQRNAPYDIVSPNNCVTMTKNFLGIKARWCWTPFQLYVWLRQQQHTEVLNELVDTL